VFTLDFVGYYATLLRQLAGNIGFRNDPIVLLGICLFLGIAFTGLFFLNPLSALLWTIILIFGSPLIMALYTTLRDGAAFTPQLIYKMYVAAVAGLRTLIRTKIK
jgi:hypothetical protein